MKKSKVKRLLRHFFYSIVESNAHQSASFSSRKYNNNNSWLCCCIPCTDTVYAYVPNKHTHTNPNTTLCMDWVSWRPRNHRIADIVVCESIFRTPALSATLLLYSVVWCTRIERYTPPQTSAFIYFIFIQIRICIHIESTTLFILVQKMITFFYTRFKMPKYLSHVCINTF